MTIAQQPYASIDEAIAQYGEDYILTSVTREAKPDKNAFTAALLRATSEIDSYIGPRYVVPLAIVPEIVKIRCIDMAVYHASADPGTATEEKRKRYDDCIDWLTKVAKGLVAIMTLQGSGVETDSGDTNLPIMRAQVRLFTRDTTRGMF